MFGELGVAESGSGPQLAPRRSHRIPIDVGADLAYIGYAREYSWLHAFYDLAHVSKTVVHEVVNADLLFCSKVPVLVMCLSLIHI